MCSVIEQPWLGCSAPTRGNDMDGQSNVAEWEQIARFAVTLFAVYGVFSGFGFIFKWFKNGKIRQNARDMTPGDAPCCRINTEDIRSLKQSRADAERRSTRQ